MDLQRASDLPLLQFSLFGQGVLHALSTRRGGFSRPPFASLNLSTRVGDDPATVQENRRAFLARLGLRPQDTVALAQVHGSRVALTRQEDRGRGLLPGSQPEEADALITQQPGVALLILAADCVPLLFWDPERRAIGAAHAGWRGTLNGVAVKTLGALGKAFGTETGDVRVGIGPAIGPCCYEVDEPVLGPWRSSFPEHYRRVTFPTRLGHGTLDLQETNRLQLLAAGVPEQKIEVIHLCTACHTELLYSERAEGRPSGRFGAVICLSAHPGV